ncbi:hypothetical protein BB559_000245 [Furculomyces boomerangus]|uniref:Uncharacterized protein n=2 Tax=Harpellales TaxID=61421 RepID=A0A2T9Z617_9FUNG|nr:hypothetical protein BB559_000245 [Furculomyces boomerangus]PVZ97181.1 hypothetical protein BB558_006871 [Smittium angustum]PWA00165.1 hypothetical protein BB558_003793 [Smittium angustum]
MDYLYWITVLLTLLGLYYIFSLLARKNHSYSSVSRNSRLQTNNISSQRQPIGLGYGSGFVQDYLDGLSSETFDVGINIGKGDDRVGLDSDEIKMIMKDEKVSFDSARLIRQQRIMLKNNIDPNTGLPLDPKAFVFSS